MTQAEKYNNQNFLHQWALNRFLQKVAAAVRYTKPTSVLDIGCAEGFVINYIASQQKNIDFTGVDVDKEALLEARKMNPESSFFYENILSPQKIYEKSYDLTLVLEVLEHLKEYERAIEKIYKVNSKYFLISVPHEPLFLTINFLRGRHWKRLGNHPEHVNTWSKRGFKQLISKHFEIMKDFSTVPWTLLLLRKNKAPEPTSAYKKPSRDKILTRVIPS